MDNSGNGNVNGTGTGTGTTTESVCARQIPSTVIYNITTGSMTGPMAGSCIQTDDHMTCTFANYCSTASQAMITDSPGAGAGAGDAGGGAVPQNRRR